MADFNISRFRTTSFMTIWDLLKETLTNMAKWFDGTTDTNLPVGAKRWSTSNKRFEQWNGTAWVELLPVADSASAYQIRVAMANACSGSTASADLATNALNLGGVAANQYVKTTDTRLSDSRKCNGQFDSAATARTALSVYSKNEADNALALKAPILNPNFSGKPGAPTAAKGTNDTQIATTAFVTSGLDDLLETVTTLINNSASGLSYGPWVDITPTAYWTGRCRLRPLLQNGVAVACSFDVSLTFRNQEDTARKTAFVSPLFYRPSVKMMWDRMIRAYTGSPWEFYLSTDELNTDGSFTTRAAHVFFSETVLL